MNLIVFVLLSVSVCLVSSWTIFPPPKPQAISSKPSVSPTIVSSEQSPELVALGFPPSTYNDRFMDIEPPSRELLPPKEPIVIPVPLTPWIVTKLPAPWIQKPSVDLLPPKLPNSRQLPVIASWSSSRDLTTTTTTTTLPPIPVDLLPPVPEKTTSPSLSTEKIRDESVPDVRPIPPTTVSIGTPTEISTTVTTDVPIKTNAPVTTTTPSVTTNSALTVAHTLVTTTESITSIVSSTEPSVTDLLTRKIFFTNDVTKEGTNELTTVLPEKVSDIATADTTEITTEKNEQPQEDGSTTEPRTTNRPEQISSVTTEQEKGLSSEKTTSTTLVEPNLDSTEKSKSTSLESITTEVHVREEVPKSLPITEIVLPSKTASTIEASTTPSVITTSATLSTGTSSSAAPSDIESTDVEVITAPSVDTTSDHIPNLLTRVGISAVSSLKQIATTSSSSSSNSLPEKKTLSILPSTTTVHKSESDSPLSTINSTAKIEPPILDLLPPKDSVAVTNSKSPAEQPLYLDLLPPKEDYAQITDTSNIPKSNQ